VRESLFNVLSARLELAGMAVLDLYAVSGALGLEALSRGAASVMFVEADRRAADVISRNIAAVGLPGATLCRGTVSSVLTTNTGSAVDLVLADPPYDVAAAEIEALPALVTGCGWAAPGTVMVIERAAASPAVSWPEGWTLWPSRRYGDTRLELAELG
jgi:16S rRNA (guanine(966)-N(2))-methyltransferase RsmD